MRSFKTLIALAIFALIGCSKDNCTTEDWIGVFEYDSVCKIGDGVATQEVDEFGNPVESSILSIEFTKGTEANTIDFFGLDIPIEGCTIDLSEFGQYELDGDILIVSFEGEDCQQFVRK